MTRLKRSHTLITLTLAGVLLAGCASNPAALRTTPVGKSATKRPTQAGLTPLPSAGRTFVATDGAGAVSGTVAFEKVANSHFSNSAANYRTQSMPSANAIVTLSTPVEEQYTLNGEVITAMSGANGAFSITGAPAKAYMINANMVGGHRLSAVALPGQGTVAVNEATTAVAEMLRWQVRSAAVTGGDYYVPALHDGRRTLADLTPSELAELQDLTASTVPLFEFETSGPTLEALKTGAGHVLRNMYVEAFGSRVSATGTSVYDTLSDKWAALLGFRPLALTRAAGNSLNTFDQGDGKPPTEVGLFAPVDAVVDHLGNMFISESDSNTIRMVPRGEYDSGYWAYTGDIDASKTYVVAGYINSPQILADFENEYAGPEYDTNVFFDPSAAPVLDANTPIFAPYKMVTQPNASDPTKTDLLFTSKFGHRLFYIPGADTFDYGRDYLAGRLYTLIGYQAFADTIDNLSSMSGHYDMDGNFTRGDGGLATDALLNLPTGLGKDPAGNLWVLSAGAISDAGPMPDDPLATKPAASGNQVYHGGLRVVRREDGLMFNVRLTYGGPTAYYALDGAEDIRYHQDASGNAWIYITDTKQHAVFRIPYPDVAAFVPYYETDADTQAIDDRTFELQLVAGTPGSAGFLKSGVLYPDLFDISHGNPLGDILLNSPTSVEFGPNDELLVADAGNKRLRLIKDGRVYTVAGGLDTQYLSGDARLGLFPSTQYLHRIDMPGTSDSEEGNLLLTDPKEAIVRKLHTGRGYF